MSPRDRFAAARAVADAVLYEGYVLYPYRASAPKNRFRWQFGVLVPPSVAIDDPSERSTVRTDCIVMTTEPTAALWVRVRCLQAQRRSVEAADDGGFTAAAAVDVDGVRHVSWDEAIEHESSFGPFPLAGSSVAFVDAFALAAAADVELLATADGTVAGRALRHRDEVRGSVQVEARRLGDSSSWRVVVTVGNTTTVHECGPAPSRDDVVPRSLLAVHTLLAVDGGEPVSMVDPPEAARSAVSDCRNEGTFPVLVGDGVVLSSPIILPDHPSVAPESAGDFFDSTEIDELLALRVLTLGDDERSEARGTDERAAAILDRVDAMTASSWSRLHGVVRSVEPAAGHGGTAPWWHPDVDARFDPATDTLEVAGARIGRGAKVRLRPARRADAQDMFVADRIATVTGVFNDVDGSTLVGVTVDDDPASEAFGWQARQLFFHPDEIEPIDPASP